jgi:molecular chaperone DnaJ
MRGKGIPTLQGYGRGDQLVLIRVETPVNLNRQQKELLEEFARISGESTQPLSKGFFDKVKDILS